MAILLLVGIGFTVAKCSADVSGHTHDVAQAEANRWIRMMGLTATAQCADRDTDHDGYVSCTLVVKDPDGRANVEPLECAGSYTINSGCRAPKAVVRGAK